MRLRYLAAAAAAVVALGAIAACGSGSSGTPGTATTPQPTAALGGAPTATATTPTAAPSTSTPPVAAAPPLTCAKAKNATLGSATLKYNGTYDGIPLLDGVWSGEDGNSVEVQACAVGDLNGDGSVDALAAVQLQTQGSTGRFYTLVYWRNVGGNPRFSALKDLGDRTPVESITISGGTATVVWLTRGPSDPDIALTIRRTSIMRVSGTTLTELSHTDVPYSG